MSQEPRAPKLGKVPQAQSITAHNIESAYVHNSRRQQRRIESYGKSGQQFIKSLIVGVPS